MQTDRPVTLILKDAYDGDSDAKSALFSLVSERLGRIIRNARRRIPGARDIYSSEDDLHEIWVRLVEEQVFRQPAFKSRNEFFSAFYKCALNLLLDRLRRMKAAGHHLPQMAAEQHQSGPTGPGTGAAKNEIRERVWSAIESLTDLERTLFGHRYLANLSQTEAFREMGLAESTGRDLLNRMHVKLGALLRSR